MKISKSMFKNLTRCPNFCSLFDLYAFRSMTHVKQINGIEVADVLGMPEGQFEEEKEEIREIFGDMFDEETGEDLTVTTDAQMEAMQEYFTETEMEAGREISSLFGGEVVYNSNTKEQKKFSFTDKGNEYYCYLDGYMETEEGLRIFEVKATTSNKFIKLGKKKIQDSNDEEKILADVSKEEEYDSIFIRGPKNILYLREDLFDHVETDNLTEKEYQKYRSKLFNRYGTDGTGKYVFDLAVERYIIEHDLMENGKGEKVAGIRYYLAVLTGDYIFDGTYVNNKPQYSKDENGRFLITLIDLTGITKEYQPIIEDLLKKTERYMNDLAVDNSHLDIFCEYKKSTQCKFLPVCFKKVLCNGSILEYMDKHRAFSDINPVNPKKKDYFTVYDLINRGMNMITDVPYDYLSKHSNLVQYDCFKNGNIYMEKEKIGKVLTGMEYPLYHLDFESFGCPLPRFRGEKPYVQSLFQFSLHIEREKGKCDKIKDHHDFLAKDHYDHRQELAEELIRLIDLSKGGSVIVYNQTFEKTRLKELAKLFPMYAKDLINIRDHVFDLLHVLEGNRQMFLPYADPDMEPAEVEEWAGKINYYHNDMHGSFSIKKILPLFSELSYQLLQVRNGTEAVMVYSRLPYLTEDEYERLYLALRTYCQQDTWAMVEILWGLQKAVAE